MDNYSKSVDNSIKPRLPPVDNSVISWIYETFSDHYARPISILKLHGLSTTNPYEWIKTRVLISLAVCDILDTCQISYALTVAQCLRFLTMFNNQQANVLNAIQHTIMK